MVRLSGWVSGVVVVLEEELDASREALSPALVVKREWNF